MTGLVRVVLLVLLLLALVGALAGIVAGTTGVLEKVVLVGVVVLLLLAADRVRGLGRGRPTSGPA
jgi:hypothetical protein